MKPSVDFSK